MIKTSYCLVVLAGLVAAFTQESFAGMNVLQDVEKSTSQKSQPTSTKAQTSSSASKDEVVDFGSSEGSESIYKNNLPEGSPKSQAFHAPPAGLLSQNWFKVFFDFAFYSRPGVANLTFGNFHNFLLFEATPTQDMIFSFDVNPNPRYYELDYQITRMVQVRFGKIWIPFDDSSPHSLFGGQVNVSTLSPGAAFLPDLWTDLGVALKLHLYESLNLDLMADIYVVNGFRDGGTDPERPTASPSEYPSFADLPNSPDNNRDKSYGGRLHALFWRTLGVGFSYYHGKWNGDDKTVENDVTMYGGDAQLSLGRTEFRAGLASMLVGLSYDSFQRGGLYFEASEKLGEKENWKVLARAGTLQLDDRVINQTDQKLVGGQIIYKPNILQYSLEHMRDLSYISQKKNYTYTALRVLISF